MRPYGPNLRLQDAADRRDGAAVYYRVHVAGTGRLGSAKYGTGAGTESYGYRNTAVQVVLVKKGERPMMSGYGRAAYKR